MKIINKMEDDVVSSNKFLASIDSFINKQNSNWFMLEFCDLGFIGKLFQTKDLVLLVNYFMMFSYKMPVDILYLLFERAVICNPSKGSVILYYFLIILFIKLSIFFPRMSVMKQ